VAELDLARPRRIHVVGAGGAGMGAIAVVLARMGHHVSGSDRHDSPALRRLAGRGVSVHVGHRPERVRGVDVVTASTAVPADDPELAAARSLGIPVLRRAESLAAIARTRRTVAVSGTHGKTTTTALLALVLQAAGWRPSCIVGGAIAELDGGAVWDDGEWFVVEADESDGTFLELGAEAAVVTNVDVDHLDHYGTPDAIVAAFDRFLAEAPGARIVGADDPVAAELGRRHRAVSAGFAPDAAMRVVGLHPDRAGIRFSLARPGGTLDDLVLAAPGAHNARNAAVAAAAASALGIDGAAIRTGLAAYRGIGRRFEIRGIVDGVTVVDDYAHNPGKVAAVLDAARSGGWERVVAVLQPHRWSRTLAQGAELGRALTAADVVVVTEVYGAGEPRPDGATGRIVLDALLAAAPEADAVWIPERDALVGHLKGVVRPGDVCLFLGAGDLTAVADDLVAALGDER